MKLTPTTLIAVSMMLAAAPAAAADTAAGQAAYTSKGCSGCACPHWVLVLG